MLSTSHIVIIIIIIILPLPPSSIPHYAGRPWRVVIFLRTLSTTAHNNNDNNCRITLTPPRLSVAFIPQCDNRRYYAQLVRFERGQTSSVPDNALQAGRLVHRLFARPGCRDIGKSPTDVTIWRYKLLNKR